jgi:hypothetical protein
VTCGDCCKALHQRHPFHRIKLWNGSFFEAADLISLGLVIHMGHGGDECPSYGSDGMPETQRWVGTDTEDEWEDDMEGEHSGNEEHSTARFGVDSGVGSGVGSGVDSGEGSGVGSGVDSGRSPGFLGGSDKWGPFIPDTVKMVIVTSNGVFRRRIRWCRCHSAPDNHIQLLRLHLFSASIDRPSTAFTFQLLDHFYIDAMECKTAAMNFFAKLRRITNSAFPATVPVGYSISIFMFMSVLITVTI